MKMTKTNKSWIANLLIFIGLVLSLQVVLNTSYTLKPWEDELISLTSSSNFFKNLKSLKKNIFPLNHKDHFSKYRNLRQIFLGYFC